MGRVHGSSPAGAKGPMQFIPSTWAEYGHGSINDQRDSIMAAAPAVWIQMSTVHDCGQAHSDPHGLRSRPGLGSALDDPVLQVSFS